MYFDSIPIETGHFTDSSGKLDLIVGKFIDEVISQLELEEGEDRYGVAIMVILTIISITVAVGRWIYDCRHKDSYSLTSTIRHPSMLQIIKFRRLVNSALISNLGDNSSPRFGKRLADAFFRASAISPDEALVHITNRSHVGDSGGSNVSYL